jgi:putative Mg2+ transporter-C (MgtC) family protein
MPIAWPDIVARLAAALVAGAAIGLNRDLHRKEAGVRTNSLVSLGAALAVIVVAPPGGDVHVDAMSRVIQGILTGIGFLGAGVIMRDPGKRRVTGLTTAAAVWLAALLGAACGAGAYVPVLVALALGLVAVAAGGTFERWFRRPRAPKPPTNPPPPGGDSHP